MSAFDRLGERVNAIAVKKLANATATIDGDDVEGEFNDGSAQALNDFMGSNPTFRCLVTAVQADPRGLAVSIKGVDYAVSEFRPDDSGMIFLDLEKA